MTLDPAALLDQAQDLAPGQALVLEFPTPREARAFRGRLNACRTNAARRSKREFPQEHPAWGTHPWPDVTVGTEGATLRVGRLSEPKVSIEG